MRRKSKQSLSYQMLFEVLKFLKLSRSSKCAHYRPILFWSRTWFFRRLYYLRAFTTFFGQDFRFKITRGSKKIEMRYLWKKILAQCVHIAQLRAVKWETIKLPVLTLTMAIWPEEKWLQTFKPGHQHGVNK